MYGAEFSRQCPEDLVNMHFSLLMRPVIQQVSSHSNTPNEITMVETVLG